VCVLLRFRKTQGQRRVLFLSHLGIFLNYKSIAYIYCQSFFKTCTLEINEAITRAKKNDQKAFNYLLDTFWDDVYGFQLKRTENENDAEDITIQTFSKAFDKIDTFDESYKFKTWLITISKNIHIDLIRKEKNLISKSISQDDDDPLFQILDESPTQEDKLITEQNLAKLLRDIKKLDRKSTRLNSSHVKISYAVFCLKK